MSEQGTYKINQTMTDVITLSASVRQIDTAASNPRIKAMILTKLEEVELLSQRLMVETKTTS